MIKNKAPIKVRSVWISDVHLGFRGCQAEALLHFLHSVETDYLFLVGDIVDFWSIKKSPYWPQHHTNVIRSILGKAKHGTKVIYVPGNHDEALRDCIGHVFGNVEIHQDYVHTTTDGKKLLVMHGDEFDMIVKNSRWLAKLGNIAYDTLLDMNHYINRLRKFFGYSYWSLATYLKLKVKNAVSYSAVLKTHWRIWPRIAASMVLYAVIFITRNCGKSIQCCIATTAIGWKAALPCWSISTVRWNWFSGLSSLSSTKISCTRNYWPVKERPDLFGTRIAS
jgi:UDP-2,3-diacylglucosamine pyrophosphatase LpxH